MSDYIDYMQELESLSETQVELAELYRQTRVEATVAKTKLDYALAQRIGDYQKERKSIGYDMAVIKLLSENNEGIIKAYNDYQTKTAEYISMELNR